MREYELYKYNPDQSSPEEREATLVGCREILQSVLRDLREGAKSRTNQHSLLVGPRGSGKTHLLLMIRDRVKADEELAGAYLPIRTAEEEYSIASLRDLLTTLLDLASKATADAELVGQAEAIASEGDDEAATELAITALKTYSARSSRKLLLLIDNLDLVIGDQISDKAEIGRLRDLLMNDSFLVLIGAAPTHFDEVSGYDQPLYNFFRLIEINELTIEQVTELLRKRAEWDRNTDLVARLDELGGRIKAIYHLTGGNPRLVLMLYQLYVCSELPEVQASIKVLLDDLTPYYKARMETLAPQQRKVMDSFARLGRPATQTELAKANRIKANQMTSIIGRLQEAGFVSVAPQKRRKTTLYMVSERLFRIWHQMRYSSAGRRRLEFLIQFLRIWYTADEWQHEADRLLGEYRTAMLDHKADKASRVAEHLDYMVDAAPEPKLARAIGEKAIDACISTGDFPRAENMIQGRLREMEQERNSTGLAECWLLMAHLRSAQGDVPGEALALQKAVEYKPDFAFALSLWGVNILRTLPGKAAEETARLAAAACEKFAAALNAKTKVNHEFALYGWGAALAAVAHLKAGVERERLLNEAIGKFRAALTISPSYPFAFCGWGSALCNLARAKTGEECSRLLQDACDKYRAALEIKPDLLEALGNWGDALHGLASDKQGDERNHLLQEACDKYRAAIDIKPDKHEALYNWGSALGDQASTKTGEERDRLYQEACDKYRAAIEIKPDKHEALNNWGLALGKLAATRTGDERDRLYQEACDKYRAAIDIKPDKHEALYNWGNTLGDQASTRTGDERDRLYQEACDKYRATIEIKPNFRAALNNWAGALAAMAGTTEARRQELLFEEAAEKLAKAIDAAAQEADLSSVAFYSAHAMHISLKAVTHSVDAQNLGRAREWFARMLHFMPEAETDHARSELVAFFSHVAREETAAFCAELLEAMLAKGFESQVALLDPFAIAIEYWRKGKDVEVLDRLNPEVRELVEQIIQPREE